MESTVKKPKTPSDNSRDRISNLPEPIIHQIFSRLDILDVIRTTAVSKKWRHVWTSMPRLDFNIYTVWAKLRSQSIDTIFEKFKNLVNLVLMSQGQGQGQGQGVDTNIQTFRLSCFNYDNDYSINRWINAAVRRNVEEMDLRIDSRTPIELPHCLFSCQSLTKLKLNMMEQVLRLPSLVCLSRLKSLNLQTVELTDEILARNLFSSCPLLDNLSVEGCIFRGFKVLDISAVNLKTLNIEGITSHHSLSNTRFIIDCPNLVSFDYSGPLAQNISLQNLSCLDDAFIYIDDIFDPPSSGEVLGNLMCKILEGLCNAKVLKLNMVFLEFLYPAVAKYGCLSILLHNLKLLKLSMEMDECYMQSLINLLKCSPNLEDLKIHFKECEFKDCWKIPDTAITCLTYHLKMVELIDVEGNTNELELVRFLLKNGHVLEKMSVLWRVDLEVLGEIIQEVMEFPRSSSSVALTNLELESDIDIFTL